MATTRIIPMHINRGRTLAQCLSDRIGYGENPEKTEGGELISSFECAPETAVSEFLLAKRRYRTITGRAQDNDVIAYQIRQSFKPGEITPEEANRIGYEFAMRFTKGEHAFVICTHTDQKHIHNHVYWNSTKLDCTGKFRDFRRSGKAVRELSDLICVEHKLSVIKNPQRHGMSYHKWLGAQAKPCHREEVRLLIDEALSRNPHNMEELLEMICASGYTVKYGKNITLLKAGHQNIRLNSLGKGYTEKELFAVLSGAKLHTPRKNRKVGAPQKPKLITEIEDKLNGKYSHWDSVRILKQMAQSVLYVQQHDLGTFEQLAEKSAAATARVNELSETMKSAEKHMAEIAVLKTHIINYSKTREVYAGYRRAGYSKKYLAEHEDDIIIHKAAKKAFDELGVRKLPTVKKLSAEYAELLAQKKTAYAEYTEARKEMRELLVHKANVEYILGLEEQEKTNVREAEREGAR